MMRIKTLIKNILPFFIVNLYKRKIPLPSTALLSEEFKRNFIEKAPLLCNNRFLCEYKDIWPCLDDNTTNTGFDAHYVYHTAWAARILAKNKPNLHIDIGSSLYFVSNVSAFIPIEFYDYRQAKINLSNLDCKSGDIVSLPFPSDSVESISCMHVVEHIGLERYGDLFDPQGDLKAIHELKRVLKQRGSLLFVVPLGDKMRIQYNAHRIYTFEYIAKCFDTLKLENFAFITDNGQFLPDAVENNVKGQRYGCGCFWFKRNI
jgi:SAM-dependent methyltransferase